MRLYLSTLGCYVLSMMGAGVMPAIATPAPVQSIAQETTNPKAEISDLRQLAAARGQDSNRQRQQAQQLLETGDYDAAQEQVKGAIASGQQATALINQALELGRALADDDLLAELYAELPERYTSLVNAYWTQANIYRTADNWVAGAETLEQRLTTLQNLLEIMRQSGDDVAIMRYQAEVAQANWMVSVYHNGAMQNPEAVTFAETALTISQEIGAPALEIFALWTLSQAHYSLGETARQNQAYDQALFHLNQAQAYVERMSALNQQPLEQLAGMAGLPEYAGVQTTEAQASNQARAVETQLVIQSSLSDVYADQQQYAQALIHAQQALAAAEQLGDSDLILIWMLDIADLHRALDDYDSAIQTAMAAETLANETENAERLLSAQLDLANFYDDLGNYPEALRYYNAARPLAEALEKDQLIAAIISNLGTIAVVQGDSANALQRFEEALTRIQQLRSNLTAPNALETLGDHCSSWKNTGWTLETQQIRVYAEQNRQWCIENTWDLEAKILSSMGSVYDNQGRYGDAIRTYQQSLEIIRTHLQDVELESDLINNIGVAYSNQGNYPLALDFLTQSLELQSHTETLSNLSPTLTSIGTIYQAQGEYDLALDHHQRALQALQDARLKPQQPTVLGNLGILFSDKGDYDQAEQFYQSGLQLAKELNAPSDQAWQLLSLAGLSSVRSEPSVALDYTNQALEIYQTLGEKGWEAVSLRNRGAIYEIQGEFAAALADYQAALAITRELDQQDGIASGLRSLGSVYEGLGQWEQAEASYRQALEIFLKIESVEGQVTVYGALGSAAFKQENYHQALEHYQQVLSLSRSMGAARNEAVSLMRLGEIQYRLGDLSAAKISLIESLAIQQRIGSSIDLGLTFNGLALVAAAQNDPESATELFQQALALHRPQGDRPNEARSLSDLGKLYADQDQPELATVFLKQAVNLYEAIRKENRVLEQDLQESYTDTVADTYRQLADVLLSQGRIPEAQRVLDLLKIEEIREFTSQTRAAWTSDGIALTEVEQAIQQAHGNIIGLTQAFNDCELNGCSAERILSLSEQQQTLLEEYKKQTQAAKEVYIRCFSETDDPDSLCVNPQNLGNDAIKLLDAHEDAILVYPLVVEDKLWLLWAAQNNVAGAIEVNTVTPKKLADTVSEFRQHIGRAERGYGDSASDKALQAQSQQLYDWLIKPLEEKLTTNQIEHLIFAHDRYTRYIPMAALHDGERYLIEKYAVSSILATTETNIETPPSQPEVSILGMGMSNPVDQFGALVNVPIELDGIIKEPEGDAEGTYPGKIYLNEAFNKDLLFSQLGKYGVWHIATHGKFEPGNPDESFLLLGDETKFPIPEIDNLQFLLSKVHLVVLSACETAYGEEGSDGREIAGISSYFLKGNRADAVMASLWNVNDASTSLLMQRFYEFLATDELTKAEALRQAQLSLLYNEDVETRMASVRASLIATSSQNEQPSGTSISHPYHWAPFVIIGNAL